MLHRASFVHFKNLRSVDVELGPLTVLVGPNGAGKTSVLQGIHLLTQIGARGGQKSAVRRFSQIFSGRWTAGRLVTAGETTLKLSVAERAAAGGEEVVALAIDVGGESERFTLERSSPGAAVRRLIVEGEAITGGEAALLDDPRVRRLGAAVLLHLDAALMVRPSVVDDPEPRLRHDGEGLASVLAYLAGAYPDRKEAIEAAVAAIVPWFRRVLVKPAKVSRLASRPFAVGREAVNVPVEEEVWGHRFAVESKDGTVVPADLLSEGTVLALGLLTVLHDPSAPRLVLLDDLDRGLHLGAQVRLVRALRALLGARPELQIVASSHSPFLLQEVPSADVRVLGLTPTGVGCRPLTDHPDYAKWKAVLGTGEMWANLGEEWVGDGE